MRVLVCGGREYKDHEFLFKILDELDAELGISEIIHGGASGADQLGGRWAYERKKKETAVNADWKRNGRAAGYVRNREMADMKPDLVLVFPGNMGTEHMADLAEAAGLQVRRVL